MVNLQEYFFFPKKEFFWLMFLFRWNHLKCQIKCNLFSQQAEAIRENIGYPEYLTNKTALAMMYKGVSVFRKYAAPYFQTCSVLHD